MGIDQKSIDEFEQKEQEAIFNLIYENIAKIEELIGLLEKDHLISQKKDVSNIATTLNNKMVEINHQFKNAGISMFAAENKRLGVVGYPFVGDAVADYLVDFFLKGLDKFKKIDDTAEDALKRIREKKARLKSQNPIKRIKARREGIGEVFTPEEMIKINELLDDYRDLDGQLWSYNLRDNIVESIIKKFVAEKFGPSFIPYVLREEIMPDLRKLGLDDLIGDIKQGLINEMEKDIKNYKEELLPPKERVQIDPKEIDFLPEPDDIEQ